MKSRRQKIRTRKHTRKTGPRKQHAGEMSNFYHKNSAIQKFLSDKKTEFQQQMRDPIKYRFWVYTVNVLRLIRQSSYMSNDSDFKNLIHDPILLETLIDLFNELRTDFIGRLRNPVKSCVPLPGRLGKPTTCSQKNSVKLGTCIDEIRSSLNEANQLGKRLCAADSVSATGEAFIEKVLQFFENVQSSEICHSFSRIDNFAKNKGKNIKGYIALFKIFASAYLGKDIAGTLVGNSDNNNNNKNNYNNTVSNASSVSVSE